MVKLVETPNVTKAREVEFGGNAYVEVPAIGDGNCSVNSFALALIDLIKRDQITRTNDEARLQQLINEMVATIAVLEERLKLYREEESLLTGNPYTDLAPHLERFIQLVKTNPNPQQLIDYVKAENGREAIAALHVGFAPALRKLGVDAYESALRAADAEPSLLRDAANLHHDGNWAGHDVLGHLARDVFNVNLTLRIQSNNAVTQVSAEDGDRPTVTVNHTPGHYNFAYPVEQVDGLAADLENKPAIDYGVADAETARIAEENETLALFSNEMAAQINKTPKTKVVSQETVTEVCDVVKQSAENLLKIKDKKAQKAEVDRVLNPGSAVTKATQDSLKVAEKLDSVKLKSYEREVLEQGVKAAAPDASDDEKLARALQNAEIMDFLNRRYDAFAGSSNVANRRRASLDTGVSLDPSAIAKKRPRTR